MDYIYFVVNPPTSANVNLYEDQICLVFAFIFLVSCSVISYKPLILYYFIFLRLLSINIWEHLPTLVWPCDNSMNTIKLMKGNSLHEKTAASVLLKPFISSYEWCHTTDAPLRMSRTPFSNVNKIHVHSMIHEDMLYKDRMIPKISI